MALERDILLNNRYRIQEILGQGGMGAVYRAIDDNLGVEVAVKENLFTTQEYARQFRREAVILASLRHPNLPRVMDHFVVEGEGQYLVMDYIEGEDLRQRMDRVGVLSEEEVIIIGAAICDALSFLHSRTQAVVHRDIKPGNVKVTPDGHIYLVDFGLAKILEGSQVTTTGARAMTPGYSPPEQYGTARTDHRSDIFSLGATLYATLTGAIPEDALARAMEQAELTTIRKRNPRISKKLAAALEKALEIRPDSRYRTAEEFKQALLSARGLPRRNTGEYTVEPPPYEAGMVDEASGPPSGDLAAAGFPTDGSSGSGSLLVSNRPAPSAQASSQQRSAPALDRRVGRRGASCWLIAALLSLLLAGGGTVIYNIYPPVKAMSRWLPVLVTNPSPTPAKQPALPSNPTATLVAISEPTVPASALTTGTTPELPLTAAPSSATASPTVSPSLTPTLAPTPLGGGSGLIAFASDRSGSNQIWVMNVNEAEKIEDIELSQVTNLPEGACQPDWSPDGNQLVFTSPCPRNQELYPGSGLFVINVDGTNLKPLTTAPGGDFDPAWSPDGDKIAFTSLRDGGRPRIYVLDLVDNKVEGLSDRFSRDQQPAWSPDGKKIAFVTMRKGPSEIWVMNADGTQQVPFSHSPNLINSYPAWSSDGSIILFTQLEKFGFVPKTVAVSFGTEEYTENHFNFGPFPMREARYSTDGLWVVFESWPEGSNHDIYLITSNGAVRTRLTDSPRIDFDPDWGP